MARSSARVKNILSVTLVIASLLAFLFSGCRNEDTNYTVKITSIEKNTNAYYCVYRVDTLSSPGLPKAYFLDECDKYQVGETIVISR